MNKSKTPEIQEKRFREFQEGFRNGGGRDIFKAAIEDFLKWAKNFFESSEGKESKISEGNQKISELLKNIQTSEQQEAFRKLPEKQQMELMREVAAISVEYKQNNNAVLDATHSQLVNLQKAASKEVGRFALPKSMDNPTA